MGKVRLAVYGKMEVVGRVMNQNPVPIVLPCHRIVGSNRKLTGYRGGTKLKQALLALEEVSF